MRMNIIQRNRCDILSIDGNRRSKEALLWSNKGLKNKRYHHHCWCCCYDDDARGIGRSRTVGIRRLVHTVTFGGRLCEGQRRGTFSNSSSSRTTNSSRSIHCTSITTTSTSSCCMVAGQLNNNNKSLGMLNGHLVVKKKREVALLLGGMWRCLGERGGGGRLPGTAARMYSYYANGGGGSSSSSSNSSSSSGNGGGRGTTGLTPRLQDHRDRIQGIQEKNAEQLKRQAVASRRKAKEKYQQKVRWQEGGDGMRSVPAAVVGMQGEEEERSSDGGGGSSNGGGEAKREGRMVATAAVQGVGGKANPWSGDQEEVLSPMTGDADAPEKSRTFAADPRSNSSSSSSSSSAAARRSDDEADVSAFDDTVEDEAVRRIYKNEKPDDVFIVENIEDAKSVVEMLMRPEMEDYVFGCDTEVMDIDITRESPCCHGIVTCFSVYCGPDFDFSSASSSLQYRKNSAGGNDSGKKRTMLWVDTWLNGDEDRAEEAKAIMHAFKEFFESGSRRKVWHNYSFDRHVLERMGISCKGFYGDTMHMARLWDSSRTGRGGYSLEALTMEEQLMGPMDPSDARGKISMKKIFGKRNIKKDGTEGKLILLPPIEELQSSENTRWDWVNYSAYDAKATWDLHESLVLKLMEIYTVPDQDVYRAYKESGIEIRTLWDIYCHVWRPFGALLTDLEATGVAVDTNHLAEAEQQAVAEEAKSKTIFREWASSKVPDAKYMNVGSSSQVVQLLFGGASNRNKDKPGVPLTRTFKVPNMLPPEEGKKPKKNMDIVLHNIWGKDQPTRLQPEIFTPAGLPGCSTQVLKTMAGKPGRARKALAQVNKDREAANAGIESLRSDFDDINSDTWSTDDDEISKLQQERNLAKKDESEEILEAIGREQGYGRLFSLFNNREEGLKACAAVDSLIDASAIDTLLSNFIIPLQSDAISQPDSKGMRRVHCSLNINTETGRLSARRPNLQNQPALEKDRYKVRQAFTADISAGNTLIVADYGQLELRILAHMANCTSMIKAFELGGDFHSRTALGMYDHIKRAVDAGDCLLEWDDHEAGSPPVPLLKDLFSSERRKAKVLNFSIAYGKTAHGLSKDWDVTLKEAEETVERWYAERAEVRSWQQEQHALAISEGYVCTILGRRRQLPDAKSKNKALRGHSLRAAINTPIQGSAADVATAAMLRISKNEQLQSMGWKLLLQVHDEVILEGPKETAAEAQRIVLECMRSPFGNGVGDPLRVELAVDSKYADTWYDAK